MVCEYLVQRRTTETHADLNGAVLQNRPFLTMAATVPPLLQQRTLRCVTAIPCYAAASISVDYLAEHTADHAQPNRAVYLPLRHPSASSFTMCPCFTGILPALACLLLPPGLLDMLHFLPSCSTWPLLYWAGL